MHVCFEDGEVGLGKKDDRKGLTAEVHVGASRKPNAQSSSDGKKQPCGLYFILLTSVELPK